MIINTNINKIKSLINSRKSFILCTYYIDAYSKIYSSKINSQLRKDLIDVYYLNIEDFMSVCNLNKRIFPIFCIFIDGKLLWKKCGFIEYNELLNEYTKKTVLFS